MPTHLETRVTGAVLTGALLVVASCATGETKAGVEPNDAPPQGQIQGAALVESFPARERLADLRAQLARAVDPASLRDLTWPPVRARFEPTGDDRVRVLLDGAAKSASFVLPSHANGTAWLSDDASQLAITFALRGTRGVPLAVADGTALYPRALGGADVVYRIRPEGTEDYVRFERRPPREELRYDVGVQRASGLRLVSGTLEFLDEGGAPRLRIAPPYVIDADGAEHRAALSVEGCAFDTNPEMPWGRPVTRPGAAHCGVRVAWDDQAVRYPALVDPGWTAARQMSVARIAHTAIPLASGRVLVAGGDATGTAEIYDPTSDTFAATGTLRAARKRHTATTLASGLVLIAGGLDAQDTSCSGGAPCELSSAELYDPARGTFTATGSMASARSLHSATLLGSGRVLVAGGGDPADPYYFNSLSSAEVYDPVTGTFSTAGSMVAFRQAHVAIALGSGLVLIAGGTSQLPLAELYDPAKGTFTLTGPTHVVRVNPAAAILGSGMVLIAGGSLGTPDQTAELYDPKTGTFAKTGSMTVARGGATATILESGTVLFAGGEFTGASDLYDPAHGTFVRSGTMHAARVFHAATPLGKSRVLITGGMMSDYSRLSTTEIWSAVDDGGACTLSTECASRTCEDGICCAAPCSGTCMTCAPGTGACVATTSADDPDTCTGQTTCDASGACKLKNGEACADGPATCASGACIAGICGPAICDGNHTLVGDDGRVDCAPYRCTSEGACLIACTSSTDCVSGDTCDVSGACVSPPVAPPGASRGCSAAPAPSSVGGAALSWLAAVVAAGRWRRRARRRRAEGSQRDGLPMDD